MSKTILDLKFNHSAPKVDESMGLTTERGKEIRDAVDGWIRERMEGFAQTELIEWANNTFKTDAELAYALYILVAEEHNVAMEGLKDTLEGFGGM